jgi:hypothetical protein
LTVLAAIGAHLNRSRLTDLSSRAPIRSGRAKPHIPGADGKGKALNAKIATWRRVLVTAVLFTGFCLVAAGMGYAYVHLWT